MTEIQNRVALVVGNGQYTNTGYLTNPCKDAKAIASVLPEFGFEVIGGAKDGLNLDYKNFIGQIRNFARAAKVADVAMFFYAGHGLQVNGHNYLVPVDAALKTEADITHELIDIEHILRLMQHERRISLVFLDACRNNSLTKALARDVESPTARETGISLGLRTEQAIAAGTLIAFATQSGHVAYDGDVNHGYFTEAFLECLKNGAGQDIERLLRCVRVRVLKRTADMPNGPQMPWTHSCLTSEFTFGQPDGLVDDKQVEDNWDETRVIHDSLKVKKFPARFQIKIALAFATLAGAVTLVWLAMPISNGGNSPFLASNIAEQSKSGSAKEIRSAKIKELDRQGYQPNETPQTGSEVLTQLLIRDGNKLMRDGDIAGARRLYEQAAATGNPEAALALGRSFDPSYFEKLPVKTGRPDPAMAAEWYKKAQEGGLATAKINVNDLKQWLQR